MVPKNDNLNALKFDAQGAMVVAVGTDLGMSRGTYQVPRDALRARSAASTGWCSAPPPSVAMVGVPALAGQTKRSRPKAGLQQAEKGAGPRRPVNGYRIPPGSVLTGLSRPLRSCNGNGRESAMIKGSHRKRMVLAMALLAAGAVAVLRYREHQSFWWATADSLLAAGTVGGLHAAFRRADGGRRLPGAATAVVAGLCLMPFGAERCCEAHSGAATRRNW